MFLPTHFSVIRLVQSLIVSSLLYVINWDYVSLERTVIIIRKRSQFKSQSTQRNELTNQDQAQETYDRSKGPVTSRHADDYSFRFNTLSGSENDMTQITQVLNFFKTQMTYHICLYVTGSIVCSAKQRCKT